MLIGRRFSLPFLLLFAACATTSETVPRAWLSVPVAPRFGSVEFDATGKLAARPERPSKRRTAGPIRLVDEFVGPKLANGDKVLTEAFREIGSFDYSPSRGEVVVSARRDAGFDIGLLSADGGEVRWVPSDPADEIHVQWAPRGNKISYVIRATGGDVVRTLHIPTSASLPVDFPPNATIHALAWDAPAERYAVAYSTPEASERVEVVRYGGEDRRTEFPAASRLAVEVEPFAPGAVLLRPADLQYGEKVPLVVWRAPDLSWNDARAALARNARVAIVVATREPGEELWRVANATPWLDLTQTFVVEGRPLPPPGTDRASGEAGIPAAEAAAPQAVYIVSDPALPDGQYRTVGNVVRVAPAVVQSVAAGFIADQLKRIRPTNGSSR